MESAAWVSVRCVFRSVHQGEQVYEERVTLWRTGSFEVAVARAEAEAEAYAVDLSGPGSTTEYLGFAQAYLLADEPATGAEVFSLMRSSDLEPEAYLDTFFDTGSERQGGLGR